mmetsp:Transcript_7761/g.18132  ORF Transcript_7761/g.18132 Transcript_7761/m.18132 type:complete len:257 (-) Transcript_7761:770-1540(-)
MGGSGQEREGRHGLLGGVEARPDDVLDRRLRRVGVGLPESHLHGPGVVLFLFLLPLGQLARRVREEVEQGQCFPGRGGVARVEQAGDSLGDDLTDSYIGLGVGRPKEGVTGAAVSPLGLEDVVRRGVEARRSRIVGDGLHELSAHRTDGGREGRSADGGQVNLEAEEEAKDGHGAHAGIWLGGRGLCGRVWLLCGWRRRARRRGCRSQVGDSCAEAVRSAGVAAERCGPRDRGRRDERQHRGREGRRGCARQQGWE